jgi:arylsulfatase A-like enzyme
VRKGDWKLVRYEVNSDPDRPLELYNLSNDPGEENDMANEHPDKVLELKQIMDNARTESEVFQFMSSTYEAK